MNVLHLINTAGPGGAETVYLSIVRGLDRERWRPVAVLPNPEWLSDQLSEVGVEPLFARSRHPCDAGYLRRLARIVREHRVDLIHSHLFGPSVTGSLLGIRFRVPVVCTVHGEGDIDPRERYRALKFAILNRGASRVVFVSDSLRRHFLRAGPLREELTTVIPNGIDAATFSGGPDPSLRAQLGIGPDEFLVGAVGNVREAKAYDVLLCAAALLKARHAGFRFVVIGQAQGEVYGQLLRLRERLGLESDVHFTGFRDDVHRALAALDLYLITSRHEGFSLSTVQAMASGLPVVATRCGGPEEILGDGRTGILVDPGAPAQVAGAIERLRRDSAERRRLGANARREAVSRFSVEAQLRGYERLYEEFTGGAREARPSSGRLVRA